MCYQGRADIILKKLVMLNFLNWTHVVFNFTYNCILIFHAYSRVTHFSIKFWKNMKKENCIKMRQCCYTKYYRVPFKWMRGKCPIRIKSKLSHIHTCLCQHFQLSLGLATVSWFWLLDQYVIIPLWNSFCWCSAQKPFFFCHSHLFSCTFVFSFKIQYIHCLLK